MEGGGTQTEGDEQGHEEERKKGKIQSGLRGGKEKELPLSSPKSQV